MRATTTATTPLRRSRRTTRSGRAHLLDTLTSPAIASPVTVRTRTIHQPEGSTPSAPAGPYLSGMDVTVSWTDFSGSCPSGYAIDHYEFNLGNATFNGGGNPVPASATNLSIKLGDPGQVTGR